MAEVATMAFVGAEIKASEVAMKAFVKAEIKASVAPLATKVEMHAGFADLRVSTSGEPDGKANSDIGLDNAARCTHDAI